MILYKLYIFNFFIKSHKCYYHYCSCILIIIINFSGAIVLVVIIIALVLYIALISDLRVVVLTGFV